MHGHSQLCLFRMQIEEKLQSNHTKVMNSSCLLGKPLFVIFLGFIGHLEGRETCQCGILFNDLRF